MVFTAKALSLVGFVIISLIGLAPQIRAQAVDGNLVGMITDSTGA